MKLFRKNSNLCDHNPPTLQTDRRTDGRTDRQTTCDRNTALCTKVHRAVKMSFLKILLLMDGYTYNRIRFDYFKLTHHYLTMPVTRQRKHKIVGSCWLDLRIYCRSYISAVEFVDIGRNVCTAAVLMEYCGAIHQAL